MDTRLLLPPGLVVINQEAARVTCDMSWAVVAAVGKVEADHGRSPLPGVAAGANFAGAKGPMQFLQPTWDAYGVDGNGDGTADVYNIVDAVWGAANYLCASGAGDPERIRTRSGPTTTPTGTSMRSWNRPRPTRPLPPSARATLRVLVDHPNLSLTPGARQDLLDGVIDQRVVDFLAWALQRHTISVSVLKTGHSRLVAGTDRISNHWHGRGVDIYAVDGEMVGTSLLSRPCPRHRGHRPQPAGETDRDRPAVGGADEPVRGVHRPEPSGPPALRVAVGVDFSCNRVIPRPRPTPVVETQRARSAREGISPWGAMSAV